jgi:hypothetical protein
LCISRLTLKNGMDFFLVDRHNRAGARITAGSSPAGPERKHLEATQFHPCSSAQRLGDPIQDRVDEVLDITFIQMRVLRRDAINKIGFDHRRPPAGR